MWKYVLKRLGLLLITTFIILSLTYILLQCLPVEVPRGSKTAIVEFYQTQVALGYYQRIDESMDIYKSYITGNLTADYKFAPQTGSPVFYVSLPVMVRYFNWLKNIVTKWDWGTSTQISIGQSAISIIMRKLPVSMKLNIISMIISVPCGIGLGIWAALKKNKMTDHIISTLVMVFISVPSFVLISFLLIWLAYGTGFVNYQWPTIQQAQNWVVALKGYIIPVMALCFGSIAGFARYTRAELCEVMSSEFLLLARTKGLTRGQAVVKHALRNSMVPIVPMIIGEFVGILSGSMILEQLYGIPGIGSLFVTALTTKDYSVVMVDMAIYTLIGLLATLVVDLSYGIVDPRIRMGASK
ncbi:MAG: ABC transporter permease [Bacilli bacterium]|nr:ABC transporter permease [Bacilli bacterium]